MYCGYETTTAAATLAGFVHAAATVAQGERTVSGKGETGVKSVSLLAQAGHVYSGAHLPIETPSSSLRTVTLELDEALDIRSKLYGLRGERAGLKSDAQHARGPQRGHSEDSQLHASHIERGVRTTTEASNSLINSSRKQGCFLYQ
ncbi:hypothetical protein MRX96_037825 [Rhipicephalus microplus]